MIMIWVRIVTVDISFTQPCYECWILNFNHSCNLLTKTLLFSSVWTVGWDFSPDRRIFRVLVIECMDPAYASCMQVNHKCDHT